MNATKISNMNKRALKKNLAIKKHANFGQFNILQSDAIGMQ